MNKIITTAIVACGFIAVLSEPLTAEAATDVFSGQGASVFAYGSNGNLFFQVNAFENGNKNKSVKSNTSGAYVYGYYSDGISAYYFWSSTTTNIQLKAQGSLPKKVIASGSVDGSWYCDWGCSSTPTLPDTIVFNVTGDAIGDQAYSNFGTQQYDNGAFKQNYHFDNSSATATFSSSSISSLFGTVTPAFGSVGISKSHSVNITRQ